MLAFLSTMAIFAPPRSARTSLLPSVRTSGTKRTKPADVGSDPQEMPQDADAASVLEAEATPAAPAPQSRAAEGNV